MTRLKDKTCLGSKGAQDLLSVGKTAYGAFGDADLKETAWMTG